MSLVRAEDLIKTVLQMFPEFQDRWERHRVFWGVQNAGLGNDMGAFSDYVTDLIRIGHTTSLPRIFQFVEDLLLNGDDQIKTVATTCFLENLLNSGVDTKLFAPLLGERSRQYCRAWDNFTGSKSEGL